MHRTLFTGGSHQQSQYSQYLTLHFPGCFVLCFTSGESSSIRSCPMGDLTPSNGCGWLWIQGFILKFAAFPREATGSDVSGNRGTRMWGCFPSSPFCSHVQGSTTPCHLATKTALAALPEQCSFLVPACPRICSISIVLCWKGAGPTGLCSISSM